MVVSGVAGGGEGGVVKWMMHVVEREGGMWTWLVEEREVCERGWWRRGRCGEVDDGRGERGIQRWMAEREERDCR